LEQQGLATRDAERPPHDHRFVAVDPDSALECTVEVFADGGRLRGRVGVDIGPVLHPDDLAADKVLALWGRARPRDFYDVHALLSRYRRERLLQLATMKDRGFTVATFVDALSAIARLGSDDWTEDGIDLAAVAEIRAVFADWRQQLAAGGASAH
jgi:Nucleotidyl transferase AbiEii toxin, Type IV TA system